MAGGTTPSAERLVVEDGILKTVWPHSGHCLPTEEKFEALMAFFLLHKVDLRAVQRAPDDEDEVSILLSRNKSVPQLGSENKDKNDASISTAGMLRIYVPIPISRWLRRLQSKITLLQIPTKIASHEVFFTPRGLDSPVNGYETTDDYLSDSDSDSDSDTKFEISKVNLFDQEVEKNYEEPAVPKEKIINRLNSHKGIKSYQMAHRLACKWTMGAGPRIGCIRDYPSELQLRALEEACFVNSTFTQSLRRQQCAGKM